MRVVLTNQKRENILNVIRPSKLYFVVAGRENLTGKKCPAYGTISYEICQKNHTI